MIEGIVGFFAGILFSWWVMPILLLGSLFCLHHEYKVFGVIFSALTIISIFGLTSLVFHWWYLAAYIPIGLIWSLWKWRKQVNSFVKRNVGKKLKKYEAREIEVSENTDRIVTWILVWPFSLITTLFGDVIDLIENIVKLIKKYIYEAISNKAKKDIKFLDE